VVHNIVLYGATRKAPDPAGSGAFVYQVTNIATRKKNQILIRVLRHFSATATAFPSIRAPQSFGSWMPDQAAIKVSRKYPIHVYLRPWIGAFLTALLKMKGGAVRNAGDRMKNAENSKNTQN